jgi:TRAP-type C4-dicarboxylate transport system substrate-binding protein
MTLFGMPSTADATQIAQAAKARSAEEEIKKKRAEVVLILGMEGTVNRWPKGLVTTGSMQNWGCIEFKKWLEERTSGRIYVDFFEGATFGAQTKALRKIQQGVFQVGNCSTQNAAAVVPIWNVLDFPYAIGPVENMWKVTFNEEINALIRKKSIDANVALIFYVPAHRWLEIGFGVKHEVRLPEQLKGLKIRVTDSKLEQAALKILPGNPTPIQWPETFDALKTGAVDGIHVPTTATLDAGLGPVIGQMVDTEWMYGNDATWINVNWVKNLKPALQESVWETAYDVQVHIYRNFEKLMRDQNGLRIDSPKGMGWREFEANGMKWVRLTEKEKGAWRDYLSFERNKKFLGELADRYGRKEYEAVVRVANAQGSAEPRRWWK